MSKPPDDTKSSQNPQLDWTYRLNGRNLKGFGKSQLASKKRSVGMQKDRDLQTLNEKLIKLLR